MRAKMRLTIPNPSDIPGPWGDLEWDCPTVQTSPSDHCCGIYEGSLDRYARLTVQESRDALAVLIREMPASVIWFSDYNGKGDDRGVTWGWIMWLRKKFPGTVRTVMTFENSKTGNIVHMWAVHLDKIARQVTLVRGKE